MAQLCALPAAIAVAHPVVPSTVEGGLACPSSYSQQTTARVPDWMAQRVCPPTAIADALPAVPSTEGGGGKTGAELLPQQMTAPVPDWIAQL
jgi:hypothetical protein